MIRKPQKGYTILECMVALFILSFLLKGTLAHQHRLLVEQQHIDAYRTHAALAEQGCVFKHYPNAPEGWINEWRQALSRAQPVGTHDCDDLG